MMRFSLSVLAMIGALSLQDRSLGEYRTAIIPQATAARHGMTRAWYTQVQMDVSRGRVAHVLLDDGTLFVQTDRAVLHAIDAETGRTLWVAQVGPKGHPSAPPAANEDTVAVITGSSLYVLDRHTGKLAWQKEIEGAPGTGPALSQQRAYVATVGAQILSYRLKPKEKSRQETEEAALESIFAEGSSEAEADGQKSFELEQEYAPPLACQSAGRSFVQPLVTRQNEIEEYVAWPTDEGYLFVGRISRIDDNFFSIRYRLLTGAGIAARPTYLPPDSQEVSDSGIIFAASRDGYVYAVRERDGTIQWRFSTAEPLVEPAVVIGKQVYTATQPGGIYCLDAKTGDESWWTPQVVQFLSASKSRVYVVDRLNRVLVLDAATGARLDVLPVRPPSVRLINDQTDRLYLVETTGLIQCLREVELAEPVDHRAKTTEAVPAPAPAPGDEQPPAAPGQPDVNPFDAGERAPAGVDDPFAAPPGDNPFR